jgi:hypothetical protein
MHPRARHYKELSGQFHAPVALPGHPLDERIGESQSGSDQDQQTYCPAGN